MANFYIDHLQSGSGANDGTSGTGAWWGYRPAVVEQSASGSGVLPGDYIWVRRVQSGTPYGELLNASTPLTTVTLQGTPQALIHIVRWPESGEPDYLMRPSGTMVDWDSDSASIYPSMRIDGTTTPTEVFDIDGDTGAKPDFIRWRGMEVWSGTGTDVIFNIERARVWWEEIYLWGGEGSAQQLVKVVGGFLRMRDCEFGHDTETTGHGIILGWGGTVLFNDCKFDSNTTHKLQFTTGNGTVLFRNHLGDTRSGNYGYSFSPATAEATRQHFYSRNGRHDSSVGVLFGSQSQVSECSAIRESEDHVPGAWISESHQGIVQRVDTPVRNGSSFSLEATPNSLCGPFLPLMILGQTPLDEFGGIPFQVSSGTSYDVNVYMRPSGWTAVPDITIQHADYRSELWVEVEYYTGSGSTRLSSIKYSHQESQTALVNDTWGAVNVTDVIPSENGWALVRVFLGIDEGGAEVLYVDPTVDIG